MNLKTWFKGLSVFVASSLVTGLAATQLDPASFNFSRAGLVKLGSLAAIIGAKAVLLYLKQSPLPANANVIPNWNKISSVVVFALVLPMVALNTGCVNSWEKTTYATLSVSKTAIDCAVAGYNHFDADIRRSCAADPGDPAFDPTKFYLAQTRENQQYVEKARQAQVLAVEAFEAYAVAKVARDSSQSIAQKEAAVVSLLAQLSPLLDAVRGLFGKAPAAARVPDERDPVAAVRALLPASAGL